MHTVQMLTVNKLMPQGRGLAPVLLKRAATVELDWDVRQKSRFDATDSQGRTLGVFLPRGTRGARRRRAGGRGRLARSRVHRGGAAGAGRPHCAEHGSPFDLMRAAYHLGNRHVQLELQPDRLLLEPDHVLADMLRADAPDRGARSMRRSSPRAARTRRMATVTATAHAHGQSAMAHDHGHCHGHDHGHDH